MAEAKKRQENHLIDQRGQELFKRKLDEVFVPRDYHPDYGIDYDLELFDNNNYQTLGEHIFIQLKSVQEPEIKKVQLFSRKNVARCEYKSEKRESVEIDAYKFSIDTSELYTIEKMGTSLPVLLVLADIKRDKCCFVCLNDYIDKIIVPEKGDYTTQNTITINIPTENEIGSELGKVALNWYGERSKLCAAYVTLQYQYDILLNTEKEKIKTQARLFAKKVKNYDFWNKSKFNGIIENYWIALLEFDRTGAIPSLYPNPNPDYISEEEILDFWRRLNALSHLYEDLWREWFLPTYIGVACTYA